MYILERLSLSITIQHNQFGEKIPPPIKMGVMSGRFKNLVGTKIDARHQPQEGPKEAVGSAGSPL